VKALRNAFGQFATGVCVVSALDNSGQPIGVTINSFGSVSLDPALALWSIQNSSDLFDFWTNIQQYAINILASDQQALSGQCAKPGQHGLQDHQVQMSETGIPLVAGALASFEMTLEQVVPAGDHHLILGNIDNYRVNENLSPLVFHKGQYHNL
jgi:flavin reductase (DIM6/NTAB) family NADH-FMN oxidoreductase RutF